MALKGGSCAKPWRPMVSGMRVPLLLERLACTANRFINGRSIKRREIKAIMGWLKTYQAQGHLAETLAAWLLRLKGYRILKRRFKTPVGEIDLIAARGSTLIAVEVKYRTSFLNAGEAITRKQRKRIEMALSLYLRNLRWVPQNIRFDAVYLIPYKWPKHIVGAWIVEY